MAKFDKENLIARALAAGVRVNIIADSIHEGVRITTFEAVYQRFIHAEVMTHRVFSRNASSSRAIPSKKFRQQVLDTPACPIHVGKNQAGMQADVELSARDSETFQTLWGEAAHNAVRIAAQMDSLGVHKQVVNRILEPFQFIRVVITATDWDNFFELRAHGDAQPEIAALAFLMQECMENSQPIETDLHLPYIPRDEIDTALKALRDHMHVGEAKSLDPLRDTRYAIFRKWACRSMAACARVSYNNFEGKPPSAKEDLELGMKLLGSNPLHASPAEHCAFAGLGDTRNFRHWTPFRSVFEECVADGQTPEQILG